MIDPPMKPSNNGLHLIKQNEGCDLKAYLDVGGVCTIGYGHTPAYRGQTCTLQQAETWLLYDYSVAVSCVNKNVNVKLSQGEFDALCDFVYNLGCTAFCNSTMLKYLNAGNYSEAAKQIDLWDHDDGKVVSGLLRRREAETQLFNS